MAERKKTRYVWFDWAVKHMLRSKANFGILEGFIAAITGERMRITGLEESEGNQERSNEKFNRVDVKAVNDQGEKVVIEVQTIREMDFIERMLFGASSAVKEQVELGHPYGDIHKVYTISVVYFGLGDGHDYLYRGQSVLRGVHTNEELTIKRKQKDTLIVRKSTDIFPVYYLVRVGKFDYKAFAKAPLEQWMNYLKTGEIGDHDDAPGLPEARQKLLYESMSKEQQKVYWDYLQNVRIEQDAITDTRAEGVAEGIAKVAKAMRDSGAALDYISKMTGLSPEEITDL